jgi:D-3-phosphoglycerate dehydrogenase / 2-oxoglutarate reductase
MNPKSRLLILNPTCLEVLEAHRAHLDQSGVDWVADPSFMSLRTENVDSALAGANALILPSSIRTLPSAEQMRRHPSLKVLSIAASGYDWLDVDAATARGIVVTFAPIREGVEVVADMAFGLMLAVARQIPHYHHEICAGRHGRGMGVMLWGKTLGIVGLGRIGKAVVKRAAGFDMRILAVEPAPDAAFVAKYSIQVVNLQTLLRESDFVSLHVRLDSTTNRMIGAAELALMKPSAFLINTARQQLVDEDALADAILKGRLAGAGLDDPPSRRDSPLCSLANVVFAPHHGNRAIEGVYAVFRCAIDNALTVLAGRRPELVVNPEVYKQL